LSLLYYLLKFSFLGGIAIASTLILITMVSLTQWNFPGSLDSMINTLMIYLTYDKQHRRILSFLRKSCRCFIICCCKSYLDYHANSTLTITTDLESPRTRTLTSSNPQPQYFNEKNDGDKNEQNNDVGDNNNNEAGDNGDNGDNTNNNGSNGSNGSANSTSSTNSASSATTNSSSNTIAATDTNRSSAANSVVDQDYHDLESNNNNGNNDNTTVHLEINMVQLISQNQSMPNLNSQLSTSNSN